MARTVKMSNLHDKSEYHSDVTMTHDKDNVTQIYVQISSVTNIIHFKMSKFTCWELKHAKNCFWLKRKEKELFRSSKG